MSPFDSIMSQYHLTNGILLDFLIVCLLIFLTMYMLYTIHKEKENIEHLKNEIHTDHFQLARTTKLINFSERKIKLCKQMLISNILVIVLMILKPFF